MIPSMPSRQSAQCLATCAMIFLAGFCDIVKCSQTVYRSVDFLSRSIGKFSLNLTKNLNHFAYDNTARINKALHIEYAESEFETNWQRRPSVWRQSIAWGSKVLAEKYENAKAFISSRRFCVFVRSPISQLGFCRRKGKAVFVKEGEIRLDRLQEWLFDPYNCTVTAAVFYCTLSLLCIHAAEKQAASFALAGTPPFRYKRVSELERFKTSDRI